LFLALTDPAPRDLLQRCLVIFQHLMEAIDISEAHESGNVGDTTIDLVWVTLK